MYEPIIDPMIFYLIELVEKLQLAPIFVLFMGVLFGFSLLLYLMEADLLSGHWAPRLTCCRPVALSYIRNRVLSMIILRVFQFLRNFQFLF